MVSVPPVLTWLSVSCWQLKDHPEQGVYVKGLSLHAIHSMAQCEQLMDTGCRNTAVAFTIMNKGSSCSHSIFTVRMEICTVSGYLVLSLGPGPSRTWDLCAHSSFHSYP